MTPADTPLLRWHRLLFVALIALLPLHTVFIDAWISWKPWLILLSLVAVLDIVIHRGYPYNRAVTVGVIIFIVAAAASWPR